MANKSVYQVFDTDALTHFGLDSAPIYGVLTTNGVEDVLLTQDKTIYEKISRLLTVPNESDTTFINKKKAFILPKCDVSQDRLKAALKEHKITVTNDYELADLVIGHEEIEQRVESGNNIPSTLKLAKLWNMEAISDTGGSIKAVDNHTNHTIVTNKITELIRYYSLDIEETLYDEWMLTGLAINLAYKIDTGVVGTIDTHTVLHSSANRMVLDESLLEMLKSQLNSYSSDDSDLAGAVIPTIDYTKNHHLLWQFAHDVEYKMHKFNRNKDVQYWIDQSNFELYANFGAEEMITYLEENKLLDKITFRYLEPICRKEISIHNRELYVFKVNVKKEYLKYLKND